jgi:hypothetical protein
MDSDERTNLTTRDDATTGPGDRGAHLSRMRRRLVRGGILAVAVMGAASAASQTFSVANLDEAASRTCRSIISVLNTARTEIDVTSTMRIGEANAVSIGYVSRPETGVPRNRRIVCAFQDQGSGFRRSRRLVGVTSDGVPLGPARLRFLHRYWIGSAEAERAATSNVPRQKR